MSDAEHRYRRTAAGGGSFIGGGGGCSRFGIGMGAGGSVIGGGRDGSGGGTGGVPGGGGGCGPCVRMADNWVTLGSPRRTAEGLDGQVEDRGKLLLGALRWENQLQHHPWPVSRRSPALPSHSSPHPPSGLAGNPHCQPGVLHLGTPQCLVCLEKVLTG